MCLVFLYSAQAVVCIEIILFPVIVFHISTSFQSPVQFGSILYPVREYCLRCHVYTWLFLLSEKQLLIKLFLRIEAIVHLRSLIFLTSFSRRTIRLMLKLWPDEMANFSLCESLSCCLFIKDNSILENVVNFCCLSSQKSFKEQFIYFRSSQIQIIFYGDKRVVSPISNSFIWRKWMHLCVNFKHILGIFPSREIFDKMFLVINSWKNNEKLACCCCWLADYVH